MPLIPNIQAHESGDYFMIKECTGLYGGDNTGGYGVQTIRPEWITSVYLVAEHIRTGKKSDPINVTSLLGKPEGECQVTPWDIDTSWKKFAVGKYRFTVDIEATTSNGEKRHVTSYVYGVAISAAKCCVEKMTTKTYNTELRSVFFDPMSKKLAELSTIMRRVEYAIAHCDYDAADRMVTYVGMNCNDCNCNH